MGSIEKEFIIVRGIPGSGKSTWARAWVNEEPTCRVRVNNDDIRNMLGPYWVPEREFFVTDIKDSIIKTALSKGLNIVVDNMNLNSYEVRHINDLVKAHNARTRIFDNRVTGKSQPHHKYNVRMVDFKTPLDICIERDAKREHPITEAVIRGIYNKYSAFYDTE